ncbi:transmembrane protein 169-like [Saccoglossus kowalevskii]
MPANMPKAHEKTRHMDDQDKNLKKEQENISNEERSQKLEPVEETDVHLLQQGTREKLNDCCHDDERHMTRSRDTLNTTTSSIGSKKITLTGTIRRGKNSTDNNIIQVTLSEEQLELMKDNHAQNDCVWGVDRGLHVLLFSLICIPFSFIASFVFAGYQGTLTWYSIFLYYYDEKTILHKIFICPVLILFFPPVIVVLTLGISLYAMVIQVSWFFSSWRRDFFDFEKGFYGWLCHKLNLEDCCAYDVVEVSAEVTMDASDNENDFQTLEAQTSF